MIRRVLTIGATAALVVLVVVGVSGHWIFADAPEDGLQHADAVVVLGGEHDGREKYGIALAHQVGATTVLLSNPYLAGDRLMSELCDKLVDDVDVVCMSPSPSTTRGEAIMAREMGAERGWSSIIVVTWRFHLPRARIIFDQCYSDGGGRAIMRGVPRSYELPIAVWEYVYLYQYGALFKNALEASCDADS
jgi:uncharacterized SAM-binding protein YcdF (DUF218 family)